MTVHSASFVVDQAWQDYRAEEHDLWRRLFERQTALLPGLAAPEVLRGLAALQLSARQIPDFRELNEHLRSRTGWEIVAVPGLLPDAAFFDLLAERRFPATRWIRTPAQLDYLQEPDLFHDVFGHVPLLSDPVFADFLAAYGRAGQASAATGNLRHLARLYWYTVEFGLIRKPEGLRIYGAGILSSRSESLFAVTSRSPNRIAFELRRVMRSDYRIDDFQQTYFVVDDFQTLFDVVDRNFAPIFDEVAGQSTLAPGELIAADRVLHRGDGSYHDGRQAA